MAEGKNLLGENKNKSGAYEYRVIAIVVTHNRLEKVKLCIEAVLKQTFPVRKILLVDTNSDDGTGAYLKKLSSENEKMEGIYVKKNIGGAGGFHLGIRYAVARYGGDVWLMDDDVIPSEDALEQLIHAGRILGDTFGFLASRVKWTDGSDCKMNRPLLDKSAGMGTNGTILPVKKATFVSMLIQAQVVRQVGLPMKEFFIWGDDQEYSYRIHLRYPCYLVKTSEVIHCMEQNIPSNIAIDSDDRICRYRYMYRNEFYISRKKGFFSVLYYLYRVIRDIFRIVIRSRDHKLKRLRAVLCGVIEGSTFHPSVEYIWQE